MKQGPMKERFNWIVLNLKNHKLCVINFKTEHKYNDELNFGGIIEPCVKFKCLLRCLLN